jgi:hypothetical protein
MRCAVAAAVLAASAPMASAAPAVPFETLALPGSNVALYAMRDDRLPRVWYDVYLDAGERYVAPRLAGLTSMNRCPSGSVPRQAQISSDRSSEIS